MEIKRGDIYYADLNPTVGCEQGGVLYSLYRTMWAIISARLLLRLLSPAEENAV